MSFLHFYSFVGDIFPPYTRCVTDDNFAMQEMFQLYTEYEIFVLRNLFFMSNQPTP
jgi:hypothetical protein